MTTKHYYGTKGATEIEEIDITATSFEEAEEKIQEAVRAMRDEHGPCQVIRDGAGDTLPATPDGQFIYVLFLGNPDQPPRYSVTYCVRA